MVVGNLRFGYVKQHQFEGGWFHKMNNRIIKRKDCILLEGKYVYKVGYNAAGIQYIEGLGQPILRRQQSISGVDHYYTASETLFPIGESHYVLSFTFDL